VCPATFRPVTFSGLRDPRPRRSFTCSRGSSARFSFITSVHAGSRVRNVGFPRHLRFRPREPSRGAKNSVFFLPNVCPATFRPVTFSGLRDPRPRRSFTCSRGSWAVLASLQVCRLVRGSGSRVPATPPFLATGALARSQKHQIWPPERVSSHVPSGHFQRTPRPPSAELVYVFPWFLGPF